MNRPCLSNSTCLSLRGSAHGEAHGHKHSLRRVDFHFLSHAPGKHKQRALSPLIKRAGERLCALTQCLSISRRENVTFPKPGFPGANLAEALGTFRLHKTCQQATWCLSVRWLVQIGLGRMNISPPPPPPPTEMSGNATYTLSKKKTLVSFSP